MYRARREVEPSTPANALDFIETLPSTLFDTNYAEFVIIEIDGIAQYGAIFSKDVSRISQN